MNLAPYFLAFLQEWRLPDSPALEVATAAWANEPVRRTIGSLRESLFNPFYLVELPEMKRKPVGLLLISTDDFASMTRDFGEDEPEFDNYREYAQVVPTGESDRLLMFPDDSGVEANLAFFAPFTNEDGSILLNTLNSLFFRTGTPRRDTEAACTLTYSGKFKNREFTCSNTGCAGRCRPKAGFEYGRVKTLRCLCT